MTWKLMFGVGLALCLAPAVFAADLGSQPCDGLQNTTVLIIRHAEKPDEGFELAPAGYARATAYVDYFKQFQIDGRPLRLDRVFCTADSKGSHRPRLTITPVSQALKLTPDNRFANKDVAKLTAELRAQAHGRQLLICWHHGEIPLLLSGLGADPEHLLPHGKWPDDVFGWLIELRYDAAGRLLDTKLIHENLMPDDQPATSKKP